MLDKGFEPLFLSSLLTAIPKPDRDTALPANLWPILVTSTWYHILMNIFVFHLCMAVDSSIMAE